LKNKYLIPAKDGQLLQLKVIRASGFCNSMRDLMLSLEAHQPKYYHPGFGSMVSRRNFGKANERRNYRIFEEFAYVLIEETLELISDGYSSSATEKLVMNDGK
jgi:hypothetical protein